MTSTTIESDTPPGTDWNWDQPDSAFSKAVEIKSATIDDGSAEKVAFGGHFQGLIGRSAGISALCKHIRIVGMTDSTVLILGETGTGKELIAQAIHNLSSRRGKPFVKVNCAAIPAGLIESELFGHERGAFTGAISRRAGRFEMAEGGTLFLDEIGDLPAELQPKLLRVLQEHEFERVGGTQTNRANVRVVTATSRDLPRMVATREFRADLYYRLNVFPLRVPPLRERLGGYSAFGATLRAAVRRMHGQVHHYHSVESDGSPPAPFMAGKCP